jgi:hypothetical protein
MSQVHEQLKLFGFGEAVRRAEGDRARIRRIQNAASMMNAPTDDDLSFLHSGLCQTALPHARPTDNTQVWVRRSSRCALVVEPGTMLNQETGNYEHIGVPYGSRARLIMIYLQSEGVKNRIVLLGSSMSAWMRSLGLAVTGGKKGTIREVKEQVQRIAMCSLKLEWTDMLADGGQLTNLERTNIIKGLTLWAQAPGREKWPTHVELSQEFHEHLREHAVPLDRRAVAKLAGNSMGLDLYATLAYRLPRLEHSVSLKWAQLQQQFGTEIEATRTFAQRLRKVLPDVLAVYEGAALEVTRHGLTLKPSKAAVPSSLISMTGLRALPGKNHGDKP